MVPLVAIHAELYSMNPDTIKSMEKRQKIKAGIKAEIEDRKARLEYVFQQVNLNPEIEDLPENPESLGEFKKFLGNDKKNVSAVAVYCSKLTIVF